MIQLVAEHDRSAEQWQEYDRMLVAMLMADDYTKSQWQPLIPIMIWPPYEPSR